MNENILNGLVAIAALGAAAQWLAWRLGIPSILVLLVSGFVVGPLTGLLNPDELLGDLTFPLVSLSAAVVLFEGGLTASWSELKGVFTVVQRLVTIGLGISWVCTSMLAYFLLDLAPGLSTLLGAILVVTGPTVIGPLLRHIRPKGGIGSILKLEGIFNDAIGAVLAVLVFRAIETEKVQHAIVLVIWGVLKTALLSSAIGMLGGLLFVFVRARNYLPKFLENAVVLPLALIIYISANHFQHESGLLAVTVMGIVLASQRRVEIEGTVEFTEHARNLLISTLFILLSARMSLQDFQHLPVETVLFLVTLILFVRPIAVFLSTIGTELHIRERAFLSFMAPRGIVAAAISSVFSLRLVEAGYDGAEVLLPVVFSVITICVTIYGLGGLPLARLLSLHQETPTGILFLGANRLARELALVLQDWGVPVTLIDAERRNIRKAREEGLNAIFGRALSEHVIDKIDLAPIGKFIGLAPDDEANTLASAHFGRLLSKDQVFQLATQAGEAGGTHLRGASFACGISYEELTDRLARGARIKSTPITEAFTFSEYLNRRPPGAIIPLLELREGQAPQVLTRGDVAQPGSRVISLVNEEDSNADSDFSQSE